ncbi:MAG: sulfatase [Chloroflexota bacterium]|nr:sulfatase [Chloroflexota bacterium]
MSDKLSVVFIQIDSLNRHFLRCYGNDWVETPNLTAFAERAAIFDNHYTGSLPCMPARREIWAGTEEFWWRGWGPLEPWDRPIAHLARQADLPIMTHLVTDHYHFFEWGSHSYFYDFHGYDFIRGHEFDNWRTDPIREVPAWAERMLEVRGEGGVTYLRNVQGFEHEEDFFAPQVMRTTAEWLDRNHEHPQFYLHVDSFDVHEPFHIPEPYRSMYTDYDYRRYNPWPNYGRVDEGAAAIDHEELEWVRAQFAGKLTMVDRWLGHVFDRLDRHNLWERTCVIVTTDHGHYLGEHGWIGKPAAPLYHTLCHIPLLVWYPDGPYNGKRISATTQTVDHYATVLELLGLSAPTSANIHSRSYMSLLRGEKEAHREVAFYGYHNKRIGVTADDGEWTLLRYHGPDLAEGYQYTHQVEQTEGFGFPQRDSRHFEFPHLEAGRWIPGISMPVWRVSMRNDWGHHQPLWIGDLLFHNPTDPEQSNNVIEQHPDVVQRLERMVFDHAQAIQAPDEQIRRLRLKDDASSALHLGQGRA